MRKTTGFHGFAMRGAILALAAALTAGAAGAQGRRDDSYRPPTESPTAWQGAQQGDPAYSNQGGGYGQNTYGQPQTYAPPPPPSGGYGGGNAGQPSYGAQGGQPYGGQGGQGQYGNQGYANNAGGGTRDDSYRGPPAQSGYGEPYSPAPAAQQEPPGRYASDRPTNGYYSQGEIAEKGRGFFGSITQGLASAIEYTYQNVGRPNGYILGEDGGGAFFAGLRYGEGTLYTKDAGDHNVYWQGPSIGYDIGGEGSKIMILVYDMSNPGDIYHRFGGVEGSTYLVGGVAVQLQKRGDLTLAIIRSGVGLRLGVNVGYLKYTRSPTWNPF